MKYNIILSDSTLRDGNHAIRHKLTIEQISNYAAAADKAGIDIVEVGHGNGLGGSSCLLGIAAASDAQMLTAAREKLRTSKLGIHFIPGFGKTSDISMALDVGVDVFRIASHCTEANLTRKFIEQVKNAGRTAYGVLMMSHMADENELIKQALCMQNYGADAVVLMDSAGFTTPGVVKTKVEGLVNELTIAVGFHAHNNLCLAVANSIVAVESGATIIDGCIKGFGAGAGNTQLETLVAVLERYGCGVNTNFGLVAELAKTAEGIISIKTPHIPISNIASGLFGLFSGYVPHIERLAGELDINPLELCQKLSTRNLVAGQEDVILEVAHALAKAKRAVLLPEAEVDLEAR
jgi:4-hydroxy 2-oxovalerate aldolase